MSFNTTSIYIIYVFIFLNHIVSTEKMDQTSTLTTELHDFIYSIDPTSTFEDFINTPIN